VLAARHLVWCADASLHRAPGCGEDAAVGGGEGHFADESGGAGRLGDVCEFVHDPAVVAVIALVAGHTGFEAVGAVVGRDDPGPAVEGVDLEAGIIGEAGQGGERRVFDGFDAGVLCEGLADLGWLGEVPAKFGEGGQFDGVQPQPREESPEFINLVRVAGCECDFHAGDGLRRGGARVSGEYYAMTLSRQDVARTAADRLESLGEGELRGAMIGFDGFIDAIIDVVDKRRSMQDSDYQGIRTIEQFALRLAGASGKSTNVELVVKEERFGGNGPLMAGAVSRLGSPTTYIGAVGREENPGKVHPLYEELCARCREVVAVAPPARTDALEFDDGKIMLGKPAPIQTVTWELLVEQIGLEGLRQRFGRATLIGVVNWVMMRGVESIWEGMMRDVLPGLPPDGSRRVFIDLCDPAKRTDEDIARALTVLSEINTMVPVTLGLNLAEAERIAAVLGHELFAPRGMASRGQVLVEGAAAVRSRLELDCVVIHPREGAGAATAKGEAAWFDGPFTATPKLSTGAGDHFNGGFAFAQAQGLPLEECLAVGCGVSGAYVRDAQSPTRERLVSFLRELPLPE
jgi:sugar/nucleoside kinase (ribokinase family)